MNANILYIDDEEDLLDLAASFFEEEGLPIETCSSFEAALSKIRHKKYDLIISDVHLPSGSGHEILSIVRKEGLFTGKVVLVTGNIENIGEERSDGYDLIVFKPIRFEELVAQARGLLSL